MSTDNTESQDIVLRETTSDELHATLERLFKAHGAGHNFQLGVLAMAHALVDEENEELRHQLLTGMVHVQASVVTLASSEVSRVSQGLRQVLDVSDEEIQAAGAAVDEMIKGSQQREPEA